MRGCSSSVRCAGAVVGFQSPGGGSFFQCAGSALQTAKAASVAAPTALPPRFKENASGGELIRDDELFDVP